MIKIYAICRTETVYLSALCKKNVYFMDIIYIYYSLAVRYGGIKPFSLIKYFPCRR